MQKEQLVSKLMDKRMRIRLKALKELTADETDATQTKLPAENFINYAYRTVYSCFDRTASLAVYYSEKFSCPLTAIIDYASLASVDELVKAQKIVGGLYYSGAEVKVKGPSGKKISLIALAVPHQNAKAFNDELGAFRNKRLAYTNALREKLNVRFKKYSITLPYAFWSFFGAVKTTSTEDLYVNLANCIIEKFKTGESILNFLTSELKFELSDDEVKKLYDETSTLYLYDLAYCLYVNLKIKEPDIELGKWNDFIALSNKYGAISSLIYKYGDLDEFISLAKEIGAMAGVMEFNGQNQAIMQEFYDKCLSVGILPIVKSTVGHPRTKLDLNFNDEELAIKYKETTLCLVGHEISSSISVEDGMFSPSTISRFPTLEERIKLYSRVGSKGFL